MQQSGTDKIGGDDDEPDTKPPAEATGSGKKQKGKMTLTKKGKPRKPKAKKPKDMPRRPLSAYNLFFREQRARIVEEREQSDAAVEEADLFSSMGKTIAKRWKMLTPEQMVKYQGLAEIEMKRYRQEMEEYHLAVAKRNRQSQLSGAQLGQEEDARLPASNSNYAAAAPPRMMQEGIEEGKSNSLSSDLLMSQLPEYRQQQQQQQYQQDAASALGMAGLGSGLLGSSQAYLPQLGDSSIQGLSGFGGLGFGANLTPHQYLQQLNQMADASLLQPRPSLDDSLRSLQLPPNSNMGNPSSLDSQLLAALSRNNNDYSATYRSQILDAQLANALQEQSRQAALGLGSSLDRLSAADQQYSGLAARMPQQSQQANLPGQGGSVSSPLIQLLRHQQEEQRQMQQRSAPSSGGGQGAGYGYGSFFPGQGNTK